MTTHLHATRRATYTRLLDEFFIDPTNTSTSSNEDAGFMLAGDMGDFGQYAVVTVGTGMDGIEVHYVYPQQHTLADAISKAVEYIHDDIFSEQPICIVDLESGQRITPRWDTVMWSRWSS